MPEGVLNIVPGSGARTGEALALHMDVDCLTFTGSGRVGRHMLEYSAQSNMKRVSLECGGKTANIVFADAPNLEETNALRSGPEVALQSREQAEKQTGPQGNMIFTERIAQLDRFFGKASA